jgi:hypothetical protein
MSTRFIAHKTVTSIYFNFYFSANYETNVYTKVYCSEWIEATQATRVGVI